MLILDFCKTSTVAFLRAPAWRDGRENNKQPKVRWLEDTRVVYLVVLATAQETSTFHFTRFRMTRARKGRYCEKSGFIRYVEKILNERWVVGFALSISLEVREPTSMSFQRWRQRSKQAPKARATSRTRNRPSVWDDSLHRRNGNFQHSANDLCNEELIVDDCSR